MKIELGTIELTYPDWQLASGITLLTGPSGVGKTTLLKAMHGMVRCSTLIEEQSSSFMPQQSVWIPYLRMKEQFNLRFRKEWLNEAEKLGLQSIAYRFPEELSVGQLQRFALLATLMDHTPVKLLDEPTSALDDDWADSCIKLIARWTVDNPLGKVLIVSHDDRVKNAFKEAVSWSL